PHPSPVRIGPGAGHAAGNAAGGCGRRAAASGESDRPLEPDAPRGARTRARQAAACPRAADPPAHLAVQPHAPGGTAGAAPALPNLQPASAGQAADCPRAPARVPPTAPGAPAGSAPRSRSPSLVAGGPAPGALEQRRIPWPVFAAGAADYRGPYDIPPELTACSVHHSGQNVPILGSSLATSKRGLGRSTRNGLVSDRVKT